MPEKQKHDSWEGDFLITAIAMTRITIADSNNKSNNNNSKNNRKNKKEEQEQE